MASIRQEKIASLIQREMAQIIQRESAHFGPGVMASVTVVRVSPDMGYAKIYISLFGAKNPDELIEQANRDKGFYRKLLGDGVGKVLRKVPDLRFFLDDSLDYSEQIDELLQ
ncbi:MAG: 30S ribosome-binding factor RbfA [Cryomorphaceae bacterium]|nr:MAG: 30S ribosome-binding factor RbfA [Cryomorphaceae bacterium]